MAVQPVRAASYFGVIWSRTSEGQWAVADSEGPSSCLVVAVAEGEGIQHSSHRHLVVYEYATG